MKLFDVNINLFTLEITCSIREYDSWSSRFSMRCKISYQIFLVCLGRFNVYIFYNAMTYLHCILIWQSHHD